MPRILRTKRIPIAATHRPVVIPAILPVISAIALIDRRCVELALRPLGNIVIGQDKAVEEIARVVRPVAVHNMLFIERRGLLAHGRALTGIVGAREESRPDVPGGTLDRAAELGRAREAGVGRWRSVLGVAVGAGNDDVEVVLVLARLRRHGVSDTRAPE